MNQPLLKLNLTPRVAEVLLWVVQGKTNADMGTIFGISESTMKKHPLQFFQSLGVEMCRTAPLRALEIVSSPHSTAK